MIKIQDQKPNQTMQTNGNREKRCAKPHQTNKAEKAGVKK